MAGYALLSAESTVQVLAPTVSNPVVYCTIQTQPSGVIASKPVQESTFDAQQANVDLGIFADSIEQIMAYPHVISGTGQQGIDTNGLLTDNVAFTVEYVPAGSTPTSITAEAVVPIGKLDFEDALIGQTLLGQVEAIIDKTYANLQAAASG
jgi:hypothetical protein